MKALLAAALVAVAFPAAAAEYSASPATWAALQPKLVGGDEVSFAPGAYPALTFSGKTYQPPVILKGPREAITTLSIASSRGIVLRGFTLGRWNPMTSAQDVTVEDCVVTSADPVAHMGIQMNGSKRITIRGCTFIGGSWAIQGGNLNEDVLIQNNIFRGQTGDVIRGFGQAVRLTIADNLFADMGGVSAAHRDKIQLWGSTTPIVDLRITGNRMLRGSGVATQDIFLSNDGAGGYLRPVISENVSLGAAYHGIDLVGATDAVVVDNFVQGTKEMGAWMTLQNNTYLQAARNWSSGNATNERFTAIPLAASATDTTQVDRWAAELAARKAPPVDPTEPLKARIAELESSITVLDATIAGLRADLERAEMAEHTLQGKVDAARAALQ